MLRTTSVNVCAPPMPPWPHPGGGDANQHGGRRAGGAGVPLLLRKLKLDPAVASAVFVTTFTDVLGFLIFLGLATMLVERLE